MWGLWGEWELWKCNPAKACMKTRRRKCNNPAPIRGGKNCADSGGQPVQSAGKVYKSTSRIHAFLDKYHQPMEWYLDSIFWLACVTDRTPTKLPNACKAKFSCAKLKKENKCAMTYGKALSSWCSARITKWWRGQVVKNYCKKTCGNCPSKLTVIYFKPCLISIIFTT